MKVDIVQDKLVFSPGNTLEKYAIEKFFEKVTSEGKSFEEYYDISWDELDREDIGY